MIGISITVPPMLDLEQILKQDRLMRAMTGLNREAFAELLPSFTAAYQQSLVKPDKFGQRAPSGGRKATLKPMTPARRNAIPENTSQGVLDKSG